MQATWLMVVRSAVRWTTGSRPSTTWPRTCGWKAPMTASLASHSRPSEARTPTARPPLVITLATSTPDSTCPPWSSMQAMRALVSDPEPPTGTPMPVASMKPTNT